VVAMAQRLQPTTAQHSFTTILLVDIVRLVFLPPSSRRLKYNLGVQDSANPFNNDARPNSWTPPLNTSWRWGVDRVYGVNLGGLFVLEPFITPDLFQRYPGTVDEFALSQAMAGDQANGGLGQLEQHYGTFIVCYINNCPVLFDRD
jgi:hypothetical protein